MPTDTTTLADQPDNYIGATIASATAVDLAESTGDFIVISGTTTITSLGTCSAGTRKTLKFSGALTLTHNATSLLLPSAGNITTAANDCAEFISLGSGNWQCINFSPSAGGSGTTNSGSQTLTNKTISLTSNTISGTSLEFKTACSDETGSGALVFANTPTLVTPVIGAATGTSLTLTGGLIQGVTTISGDGAITIAPGIVKLTKGSAAAITLAAPSSNDGVVITIMSTTDFAHVVTVTGGMWDGTATTNTTVTFPVVAGGAVTLMASGTDWYVLNNQGTTIAP